MNSLELSHAVFHHLILIVKGTKLVVQFAGQLRVVSIGILAVLRISHQFIDPVELGLHPT